MCSDYAILLVAFGLDSPLPRRDQLLRLGKRLKKSVSVYMCLRLCYPFPGKEIIRLVKKTRIKNQKERRERNGGWRLHNRLLAYQAILAFRSSSSIFIYYY